MLSLLLAVGDTVSTRLSTVSQRVYEVNRQRENTIPILQLSPGLVIMLLFGISFGIIFVYSFLQEAPPQGALSFTTANYGEFFGTGYYHGVLWDSLVISVESTVLALVFAYPAAYYLAFTESDAKHILLLLFILPFWINLVIRTYAWRLILGNQGLINWVLLDILGLIDTPMNLLFSQASILLGLVHIFLPYMVLPIYVALDALDRSHVEAAQNLGANELQAFYEVTLPQSLPGVAAGVMLSFVLAFGAFVVPQLLGGTANIMIANVIGRTFIQLFDWGLGSAIAVGVTVFVLTFVYVFNRLVGLEHLYGEGGGMA